METKHEEGNQEPLKPHKPIETDYAKHQEDPGPSPQAVNEYDKNGAAVALKWIIPILILALLIYWLFFK
ncbi:hypothetical protein [Pedobacter gandavensis]|uniref:Uncharacterized protein n=1 Tax=Pedobacter gandavensis TaxID=2679963 RepID=A0ABR6EUK5_9SPHI|nr:hypothetical protein [Pedobacter gandavensis]MBB2148514.1 hypothetical protein [Pedobacter gandavensis]